MGGQPLGLFNNARMPTRAVKFRFEEEDEDEEDLISRLLRGVHHLPTGARHLHGDAARLPP
jgi:hypothetical protein